MRIDIKYQNPMIAFLDVYILMTCNNLPLIMRKAEPNSFSGWTSWDAFVKDKEAIEARI